MKISSSKLAEPFSKNDGNYNDTFNEEKNINESEIKRLASLKKQKQIFKAREQIIKNALNIVDNKRNNKIIFDENVGECDIQNEYGKKMSLFNDDDQEENDLNFNDCFNETLKPKFQTLGGDDRFKLNERFLDDDNDKVEENESNKVEDEFTSEKKMQLEILQDVLGKPIVQKHENNIHEKKKNQMIRYDPNDDKHRNYEIENNEEVSTLKKKRKKNSEIIVEEAPPIPVSNEIFYSVSNVFNESLKPQEEFSLLKTFGSTVPPDEKNEHYETEEISKKQRRFDFTHGNENPFKYDSSDDEDTPDQETPVENSISKSTNKITQLHRCDTFFFTKDDPRFKDAEEFFETKSESHEAFENVRRELKQIVRSKIRNNARKNQPWRKKIGTKSKSK